MKSSKEEKMPKEEPISVVAEVLEALPDIRFRLKLIEGGAETLGYLSGKMNKNRIKILPGDRVQLELSPYDLTKGRIVRRLDR